MAKKEFKALICRQFCGYFKEGSKEDLACQGALAVEKLLKRDVINISLLSKFSNIPNQGMPHDPDLDEVVCRHCSFEAEDCDFQSKDQKYDADPCGGYRLLQFLRLSGMVTRADLEAYLP
jgi:hypothetical protein